MALAIMQQGNPVWASWLFNYPAASKSGYCLSLRQGKFDHSNPDSHKDISNSVSCHINDNAVLSYI